MSSSPQEPSKTDVDAILKRVRSNPANKVSLIKTLINDWLN